MKDNDDDEKIINEENYKDGYPFANKLFSSFGWFVAGQPKEALAKPTTLFGA